MKELDAIADLAFAGKESVNIKFFRGSRDLITVEEFMRELHSAMVQVKTGLAKPSAVAPKSARPLVNVRQMISDLG